MVKMQRLLVLLILFCGLWTQVANAARVQAVADRDQIADGESLNLELRVNGSPDEDPDLAVLDKAWEVISRSQSSQIQIINGDFNRSLVYALTLIPRATGDLTIPAICFGSDCSTPLTIHVTAADQAPAGGDSAELLLEAEATPSRLLPQQQLLFTIRLLHRVDLRQGALSEPQPTGVEAVVQKLGDDRTFETRRGGRLYQVIERSYAIFPQASGTLEIPPLRFDGEISRGPARFDPFGQRGERVRKRTETMRIEVQSAPPDRNGRNWLPAQALELQDDWQGKPLHLTVGEPATRTLTLTAKGLQAAQLGELPLAFPSEFKSYPDQPSRSDDLSPGGINGTLQQKIALVPTRPGRYQLPALNLDWWDVATQQWRQAHLDPVTIDVSPAAGVPAAVPAPAPPAATTSSPEAKATAPPLPEPPPGAAAPHGFWPWLSLVLGLGWLATLLLVWRKRGKGAQPVANKDQELSQQSQKTARQAVLQAARGNDPRATRQALRDWCRALWPDDASVDLERLGQTEPAWRDELNRLNRALYASKGENWNGAGLLEVMQTWDRNRQQSERMAGKQLPGLYPNRPGGYPQA